MKKVYLILITLLLVLLTACGQAEQATPDGGPNVTISVPREIFGDTSNDAIIAQAESQNMTVTIDDEAALVTYTMSQRQHEELLLAYKTEFEENLITAQDTGILPGLVDVDYDENMVNFNITVIRSQYEAAEERFDFGFFYSSGLTYQLFAGIPSDDVEVILHFYEEGSEEAFDQKSMIEAFNDARAADNVVA